MRCQAGDWKRWKTTILTGKSTSSMAMASKKSIAICSFTRGSMNHEIGVFHTWYPNSWVLYFMEIPFQMGNLGLPLFWDPPHVVFQDGVGDIRFPSFSEKEHGPKKIDAWKMGFLLETNATFCVRTIFRFKFQWWPVLANAPIDADLISKWSQVGTMLLCVLMRSLQIRFSKPCPEVVAPIPAQQLW